MSVKSPEEETTTESIFDRVGGDAAIAATVSGFYERVLADPTLSHFFDGVNMEWLQERQRQFFTQALGGPKEYEGGAMDAVHEHLDIGEHHFDQVVGHLVGTLESLGVDDSLIAQIAVVLGPLKSEIVAAQPVEGDASNEQGDTEMGTVTLDQSTSAKGNGLLSEASELLAVLDNLQANVILADTNFVIVYANESTVNALLSIEDEIRAAFNVGVDQVIGASIHTFHKDPARIEKLLTTPSALPHSADFAFGDITFRTRINSVKNAQGEVSGYIVYWDDITENEKIRKEQARVQAMVENSPTNVVMADADLNITYANPASVKTLTQLAQYLPIPVNQVVGSNIDIFHKDPSHQRKLLADPKSLPVTAQIQIGPETADLLVSAIFDNNGAYLGPMLTWEIVTEKVELEKRINEMAETLTKKVGATAQTLASSSEELSTISAQMSAGAEETSSQANVVAAAAEQVSKNVDTVASGTEEMSASIKEIASNATEAAKVAEEAVNVADTTKVTMSKLDESSAEIGQVIKVITSIAQQTNLLALNATIEAARAGEAGKGFAVVANEVKELAKETAKATEDISQKIEAIQNDTNGAVEAIAEIGTIINRINDIQTTIASAVEEQTATTAEIARNVTEAAKGSTEIAENITGVAKAAQDTASGANDAQGAAAELSTLAQELQVVLDEATQALNIESADSD